MKHIVALLFAWLVIQGHATAQVLTTSNVKIEWKVENRFRLFRDAEDFKLHETAWRQYLSHVEGRNLSDTEEAALIAATSVTGAEHVLNDRYIPFTRHLRTKYDWRGWASRQMARTCYDPESRTHKACGGVEAYVSPTSHQISVWLKPLETGLLFAEYNCQWQVDGAVRETAPCDQPVSLAVPYPDGATISVNPEGEAAISVDVAVKDLLIVGLGDSFASGEGNPDVPVTFTGAARYRNVFPRRARNDGGGNAQWLDELCHRSLYGHQLRTALQVAVENPQTSVTFLGYACSGAEVAEGLLGPQSYMDYMSRDNGIQAVSGGSKDSQLRWLLRELCAVKTEKAGGMWTCPGNQFRRPVDYLLLSIGGNDIGFSNLVTWATLRDNTSSALANVFGASVSPKQFAKNMQDDLPGAYARLAKVLSATVPLRHGDVAFDASRVILASYPDILENEEGMVCRAGPEGEDEDLYPANQSLDFWRKWLVVTPKKLGAAHGQLEQLHRRMATLAEDHGWHFAARAYEDRPFRGHGFCARNMDTKDDPAEQLIMPCVGTAKRDTQTCSLNLSGKEHDWRPLNPEFQNFPYALRQRWVRSFNDAYMVINQKVTTRDGHIDEAASDAVFSETTGAMHPTAEGHAAMADAIMMDLRARIAADVVNDTSR